jgi:predicted DNA-binding ribbon-helix-helix protein
LTPAERLASASVRKHSLVIAGHKTSVSLEGAFWDALKKIAKEDGISLASLVARIDASRGGANLSSALRVFTLERAIDKSASASVGMREAAAPPPGREQ